MNADYAYHSRLVDMFEASEDASKTNREKAERDIDYYDGKQWTEDEARKLRRRGEPVIAFNLVRQKVDYLTGLERSQRTRPKAYPRTQVHEQDAHAATDALRFVADENRYDQVRSRVWADLIKAGWGGVEVLVEAKPIKADLMATTAMTPPQPEYDIKLVRCPWDRMFWDPYSFEEDYSDASYLGLVVWMDREEAVRRYGEDAGKVFDETVAGNQVGSTYDDKPKLTTWVQYGKRKRVRVVQMYHVGQDGEWDYCEFTKGGLLKSGPSPWMNEDGEREHPYVWRSAYVDRDNNRYGAIRDLIDPQDEVNKRRSKSLHHYTSRQTFGTQGSLGPKTTREMRAELARPDGHIEMAPNTEFGKQFGIIPTNDQAQGHFELLTQATSMFEIMGPNAAMQGKADQGQSGRAILANQQGGAVQVTTLTDTLADLDHGVYRKAWNRVRQFWTGPKWVRVTDDENNLRWAGLNVPQMQQMQLPTGEVIEQPVIDPMTGQPVVQNPVSELDVDITLEGAPDVGTLVAEEFEQLIALKQFDVNNEIPIRAIIAANPALRGKDKLLTAMDEAKQANVNPQAMQIEMRGALT